MTDANHSLDSKKFRIPEGNVWAIAWRMTAALGAIGSIVAPAGRRCAAAAALRVLVPVRVHHRAHAVARLGVLRAHPAPSAGWSVTVRRSAEFVVSAAWILPVLFLPMLPNLQTLYPWWGEDNHGVAHAQEPEHEHAAAAELAAHQGHEEGEGAEAAEGGEEHGPHHLLEAATLKKKGAFLNHGFFYFRAVLYFLIWFSTPTACSVTRRRRTRPATRSTRTSSRLLPRRQPSCSRSR